MILDKIKEDQVATRLLSRSEEHRKTANLLTTLLGECETLHKNKGRKLQDSEVFAVIEKFIKNNLQTIEAIGNDDERHNSLSHENEILKAYLPSQLTAEELKSEISKMIEGGKNNIGAIMGTLKKEFPNRYDGKLASGIIKELL